MTPEEIQALREKHHNDGHDCCAFCTDGYVWAADYPCDVIKVLDATEYPPGGQNVECDTWLGSHPHQARSRLHPGLDLTTVTTTTVLSVKRNYE